MSSPTTPNPEQQNQTPQEQASPPKPQGQNAPADPPQSASLLDKIVTESQLAGRDALIVKRAEFDQKQRLARMFANSGCFQDIDKDDQGQWLSQETSIARAIVKIELGESMGFTAAESMTGIDIIKGRVAVGASLRGARMQRAGFSWPQMTVSDKGCWMPLCYKGEPMMCPKVNEAGMPVYDDKGTPVLVQVVVSFTENDARMLGLLDKKQSMYLKDPSSMYFARTITRAQRRYGPGVLGVDALDTYEARDIEPETPAAEILRTAPPDNDPRWFRPGSNAAAEAVVAEKLAAASKQAPVSAEKPQEPAKEPEVAKLSPTVVASIVGHLEKQEQSHMMRFNSWDDIGASTDERMDPKLGLTVEIGGSIWTRESVDETWTRQPGQAPPPTTRRPDVPVFGRPKK